MTFKKNLTTFKTNLTSKMKDYTTFHMKNLISMMKE